MKIVAEHDGVYVGFFEHLVVIGIGFEFSVPVMPFNELEFVLASVADGGEFQAGAFGRVHERLASAGSYDSDSDFVFHLPDSPTRVMINRNAVLRASRSLSLPRGFGYTLQRVGKQIKFLRRPAGRRDAVRCSPARL